MSLLDLHKTCPYDFTSEILSTTGSKTCGMDRQTPSYTRARSEGRACILLVRPKVKTQIRKKKVELSRAPSGKDLWIVLTAVLTANAESATGILRSFLQRPG